jgi:tight adherence protein B
MMLDRLLSLEAVVVAAVFGAVFALTVALFRLDARKSTRLQARLARHAYRVQSAAPRRISRVRVLGRAPGRRLPLLDRFAFTRKAEVDLRYANVPMGVTRYLLIRAGVAVIAFAAVLLVTRSPLAAAVAALVGFMIPRFVLRKKGARRSAAFENLLAETLDLLVGSLRAGQGLVQAVESTSYEQPEPMRAELRRIVGQVNMGVSITDAMEGLTTRFDSRDVDLLAAAIAINRETGGNLTEVLERLARTVRQRREIRAEARSLTAAPRATGYILAILPFAITGYTVAISPIYREQLLFAPLGRLLLIGSIVWSLVGFVISQKLAKAEY